MLSRPQMIHGPATGLELLGKLDADERLKGHYRLEAVRGHFKEMAGDSQRRGRQLSQCRIADCSLPERNFLLEQAPS